MDHYDYSSAIRWLVERGVSRDLIARYFKKTPASIPIIAWREKSGLGPKSFSLVRSELDQTGAEADSLLDATGKELKATKRSLLDLEEPPARIRDLEEEIDDFGSRFWRKVRNHSGIRELGLILRRISLPGEDNLPLLRARARILHLTTEIYLHAGYSRTALIYGKQAYRLLDAIYRASLARSDLERIAKLCLLISQAFIIRQEFGAAERWLERSRKAFEAASVNVIDPEYLRQLAMVQIKRKNIDQAVINLRKAGELLPEYQKNATDAQVRDISERFLNFFGEKPDWEAAFELKDYALKNWPEYDIHRAINVNWAASVALSTDSPEAHQKAEELLKAYGHLSKGFLHQETRTFLLKLTPELPKELWADWVQFCLNYNAFRNK